MARTQALLILFVLMAMPLSGIATSSNLASTVLAEESASSEPKFSSSSGTASADVETWRVGDKWIYAGSFDVAQMIASSGVNANIGIINADSTTEVTGISTMSIENQSTLVYSVRSSANFDKNGVTLDGYSGDLSIDYQLDELWRASDLAVIQRDMSLAVDFEAFGLVHIDVADITIATGYAPPREGYDFPLRMGERWSTEFTGDVRWSGQSDYFTMPADEIGPGDDNFEVTGYGEPTDSVGNSIQYTGCADSFEVTSFDSQGKEDEFIWYCPEVRSYAWLHTESDPGIIIDFRLKTYQPVQSTGVSAGSSAGERNTDISLEFEYPITALNASQEVWVNLSDSAGNPVSGETVELRHEREGVSMSATTAANGSASFTFDAGDALDPSPTNIDWASHGVIAWQSGSQRIGASTMTLDDNLVGLDLVAMVDRVTIIRNRSGELRPLNEISGYNVLPDDELTFELPVMNRGIITSIPTVIEVQKPDGTMGTFPVPALSTYEENRAIFTWAVPSEMDIGQVWLSYEVDPGHLNTQDADFANNLGEVMVFVGRLPEVVVSNFEPVLTNYNLTFSSEQSFDPDGGNVTCEFDVEYESFETRAWKSIASETCTANLSWIDDGVFEIIVTVIDEEQDEAYASVNVTVLNRKPTVMILSPLTEVPALSMVQMDIFANDSDSEDPWPGMVDIHWPTTDCEEGYYTRTCTTTSYYEGMKTFSAYGTDDDGEQTIATWDVLFTNAVPKDVEISMWDADGQLIEPDQQGTYHVEEDESVWMHASSVDSLDDMDDIEYRWRPDDQNPAWFELTIGGESALNLAWTRSGINVARLEVVDDDGASSGSIETRVQVDNLAPVIEPLPSLLPFAESQSIEIEGTYSDTASDVDSLLACWDVDPGTDSDGAGSADDDCDIIGSKLIHHWDQSGIYPVIFHVEDDDGARTSMQVNISVVNQPPRPAITLHGNAEAGVPFRMDANSSYDAPFDLPLLTFTWDVDASVDSDGDGNPSNDADHVGTSIEQVWNSPGSYEVTLRALDEDVSQPGTTSIIVEVSPNTGGFIGDVLEMLVGEDSSLITQVLSLVLIGLIGMFAYRRFKPSEQDEDENLAPWQEQEMLSQIGEAKEYSEIANLGGTAEAQQTELASAPPEYAFGASQDDAAMAAATTSPNPSTEPGAELLEGAPALPAEGLPEGWTMEQWKHYGQGWLDSQQPKQYLDLDL